MTLVSDILRTKKSLERIQIELWAKAHMDGFGLAPQELQAIVDHWYEEVIPVKFPVETKEDVDSWSTYFKQEAEREVYRQSVMLKRASAKAVGQQWDF